MSIKPWRLAIRTGVFYLLLITTAGGGATETIAAPQPSPAPRVVVSVQPLHALVSSVMQGVGEPQLLLRASGSPHAHNLRPSQMRALSEAAVVFWFGAALEQFLVKPIQTVNGLRSEPLLQTARLPLRLAPRRGGVWQHRDRRHEHDHAASDAPDIDPHVWLDPRNARALAERIRVVLSEIDPDNQATYQRNLAQLRARLTTLEQTLRQRLAPVSDVPYIVFHDAYQYFERRFGLNPVGSLTVDPGRQPGARRVQQIGEEIRRRQARCVFSEPQFQPPLVATLVANSTVKRGELDPLGATLAPGPNGYFALLDKLATALVNCLSVNE